MNQAEMREFEKHFVLKMCNVGGVISENMKIKFLTKTARTQRQTITFFRDPFKLVPVGQFAEIADKFTRNEILAPNDIRAFLGIRPSEDPRADELRNRNINAGEEQLKNPVKTNPEGFNQNGT